MDFICENNNKCDDCIYAADNTINKTIICDNEYSESYGQDITKIYRCDFYEY